LKNFSDPQNGKRNSQWDFFGRIFISPFLNSMQNDLRMMKNKNDFAKIIPNERKSKVHNLNIKKVNLFNF